MNFILENEQCTAIICDVGAEIISLKRKDKEIEYIWQGEAWKYHAPILFPQVGSRRDLKQLFKGQCYSMENHGFARDCCFKCIQHGKEKLHCILDSNEETRKCYPYHFRLEIFYELKENAITIKVIITNQDEAKMPYGFGLHPAFNCPLASNKKMEDYEFVFDTREEFLKEQNKVRITRALLDSRKLHSLKNCKSKVIAMADGENGVSIQVEKFPIVTFWSMKGQPFVCIEPWMNQIKKDSPLIPFEQIEGIEVLEPNQSNSYKTEYMIF